MSARNPTTKSNPEIEEEEEEQEGEGEGEGEGEEEGECGFCLFMKGGGCREEFIGWEECIKEAEEKGADIVEKCFDITSKLRVCMEAHADYYDPILRAEKVAAQEAVKELERQNKEEEEPQHQKQPASVSS